MQKGQLMLNVFGMFTFDIKKRHCSNVMTLRKLQKLNVTQAQK